MSTDLDSNESDVPEKLEVEVENIGGINEATISLTRGITVLTGRNATNRTSMLQAIMAGLGSDKSTLKADAEKGHVSLKFGGETYSRSFERKNGTILTEGEPYLDDPTVADLFAFLLESNEARRSVSRGENLHELIMRPVDTDKIQKQINKCENKKDEIDKRLAKLEKQSNCLPKLEEKRAQLEKEIEKLNNELEEAEEVLEGTSVDLNEHQDGKKELENKLDELRSTRSNLDQIRNHIETNRESVEALESEHEELEDQLNSLSIEEDQSADQLEAEIEALQDEKDTLSNNITQLQSIIQFNEKLLTESGTKLNALTTDGHSDDDHGITDQLLEDSESVTCWTCGSSVKHDQIKVTIEQLRNFRKNRLKERNEVDAELQHRRDLHKEIEKAHVEKRQTENRLKSLQSEIAERTERIEELIHERDTLTDAIADLEDEVEELEDESYTEILDQHREANKLEFSLERKESEKENIEEEIASIEAQLTERDRLEEDREAVSEELTDLRTRIDQIESKAVENFNEHMENVLEILHYDNLDRIWIDRSTEKVREGRKKVTRSTFNLKIVRTTDEGLAYEDSIDHLSESEREVTGLVFALAGYLVHNVYEDLPFILLDSLEAIDGTRISDLIAYFESYVPYLVVALLVEDAEALETPHNSISVI